MKLTAEGLRIERGGRLVVADLSFSAEGGTALVVTGPNGVGKSTLLRTIVGLIRPVAGRLRLEGDEAEDDGSERPLAEACHYLGHLDGIKTALTVRENLIFWRDFYGTRKARHDVEAALAEVDLDDLGSLSAGFLSAGQRRRLALARLLVAGRPIWLLDEPTSALDARSEARFVDLVNAHLDQGGLVVAATHVPLPFTRVASLELLAGEVA